MDFKGKTTEVLDKSTETNLLIYGASSIECIGERFTVDTIYNNSLGIPNCQSYNFLVTLFTFGVFMQLLNDISDYLYYTEQMVKIKNNQFSTVIVSSGVPQGSHLAPLLLRCFLNDMVEYSISLCY